MSDQLRKSVIHSLDDVLIDINSLPANERGYPWITCVFLLVLAQQLLRTEGSDGETVYEKIKAAIAE